MRPTSAASGWRVATLLAVPWLALAGATGPGDIRGVLPDASELPGWEAVEPPRVFRGEDLYELIDGGADLYLEYGFTQAVTARYAARDRGTLQIDVYEMADATAAFGIHSLNEAGQGATLDVGQAAQLFDYYLTLWQGTYFITITITEPPGDAKSILRRAAAVIVAKLPRRGETPALMGRLPARGLTGRRFFRGPLGAANSFPFAGNDPFQVREGACGFYPGLRLLLFRYPDSAQATARLAAAGRALAATGVYREWIQGAASFECLDADSNRIAARTEGDCIWVRISEPERNK